MKPTSPADDKGKPTLATSRRNFIKGAQLALGAGAALGISAALGGRAHAMGDFWPHHHHHRGEGWGSGGHCFLAGTRIETATGAVAVEELRIGDSVLTVSGGAKPIKWIGKREASAAPVKIVKFAIDGGAPLRDLYVTPRHAIYIDGYLVPAIDLVNGVTILANAKCNLSTFAYYHIEFETHEVIQAEGLPVESYLPQDSVDFDNADEYRTLYGPRAGSMVPFAPILSYAGVEQQLASHIRSTLACIYDMRKPLDKIRDRIADRAELAHAA